MTIATLLALVALVLAVVAAFVSHRWLLPVAVGCVALAVLLGAGPLLAI